MKNVIKENVWGDNRHAPSFVDTTLYIHVRYLSGNKNSC
ncbi:hypothetical protein BN133_2560 [Cronobacter dublinensis 582]|nr:hypothetical protein BN133_2560 [Cronobacter dublinensis 582]